MQISDILSQIGGVQSMARDLGVSETDAASATQALLPAILGGFKKQAQAHPDGLDGLGGLLGQLGGTGLADQVLAPEPTDVSAGNDVLGQIFGSKDVSRTVTQSAAAQSGLDPSLLRKMLPMLAMLVTGFLAHQSGAASASAQPSGGDGLGGAIGGILGGLLGGQGGAPPQASGGGGLGGLLGGLLGGGGAAQSAASGGGVGGLLGGLLGGHGGGGLSSMLDMNGDGNPLDDILKMASKAAG